METSVEKKETFLVTVINERISFCNSIISNSEKTEDEILKSQTEVLLSKWNELKNFADGTVNKLPSEEVIAETIDKNISQLEFEHKKLIECYTSTFEIELKDKYNSMLSNSIRYLKLVKNAKSELEQLIISNQ